MSFTIYMGTICSHCGGSGCVLNVHEPSDTMVTSEPTVDVVECSHCQGSGSEEQDIPYCVLCGEPLLELEPPMMFKSGPLVVLCQHLVHAECADEYEEDWPPTPEEVEEDA